MSLPLRSAVLMVPAGSPAVVHTTAPLAEVQPVNLRFTFSASFEAFIVPSPVPAVHSTAGRVLLLSLPGGRVAVKVLTFSYFPVATGTPFFSFSVVQALSLYLPVLAASFSHLGKTAG